MTKQLNVGLIGFGFIGKVHTIAYRDIPLCFPQTPVVPRLAALLRSGPGREDAALQAAGFPLVSADPAEFNAQPLDVVDVCTPNYLHLEQVREVLRAGRAIYCEKPLAANLADARAMADLAERAGTPTHVAFIYRYTPAVRQMKALIAAGAIGNVLHFRARMFHGSYLDYNRPMSWRLRHAQAGGGAFMDLGVHLVDMARYLLGDAVSVQANMRTFICERCSAPGSAQRETVDVDDWALCTLEMANGSTGVLEVTRMAAGAHAGTEFEVFGDKGSLIFQEAHPDEVRMYDLTSQRWTLGAQGVPPADGERPAAQVWPNSKFTQGYFTNCHLASAYEFLLDLAEGKPSAVDFRAGAAAQEIVEATYTSAAHGGESVRLPI